MTTTFAKQLSGYSHEINSHIGFIKFNVYQIKKLLDQTPIDIKQSIKKSLDEIEEDANEILKLIESIKASYATQESEGSDGEGTIYRG